MAVFLHPCHGVPTLFLQFFALFLRCSYPAPLLQVGCPLLSKPFSIADMSENVHEFFRRVKSQSSHPPVSAATSSSS